MAVFVNTQSVVTVGEISQYLSQNGITANINRGDGDVNIHYSRLLYLVRKGVQWAYEIDATDETLNATAQYLYALCGRYINQAQTIADNEACSVPIIITQPVSQTAEPLNSLLFTVIASSVASIEYKWYVDGVLDVSSSTNTLQVSSVVEGVKSIYVKAVTPCGSITSNTVTATFTAAAEQQTIYYGFQDVSTTPNEAYILANSSAFFGVANDDVSCLWSNQADPRYYFLAIPVDTDSDKNYWYESALNQGNMGSLSDLFGASATVEVDGVDCYVWVTNYPTEFEDNNYVFSKV